MENSRNTQLLSSKLYIALSNVIKFCTHSLFPTHSMNSPFVQHNYNVCTTHPPRVQKTSQSLCSGNTYFTYRPKCQYEEKSHPGRKPGETDEPWCCVAMLTRQTRKMVHMEFGSFELQTSTGWACHVMDPCNR